MSSSPAKAEALNEAITFEYDGETYEIPPSSEWDLDILESYEDGKIAATTRALLGSEQWSMFRSKPRKITDLKDLFEGLQKALGLSGN